MTAAMQEALAQLSTEGQGSSIPLCNVLDDYAARS
jgi:hypothetical protein